MIANYCIVSLVSDNSTFLVMIKSKLTSSCLQSFRCYCKKMSWDGEWQGIKLKWSMYCWGFHGDPDGLTMWHVGHSRLLWSLALPLSGVGLVSMLFLLLLLLLLIKSPPELSRLLSSATLLLLLRLSWCFLIFWGQLFWRFRLCCCLMCFCLFCWILVCEAGCWDLLGTRGGGWTGRDHLSY